MSGRLSILLINDWWGGAGQKVVRSDRVTKMDMWISLLGLQFGSTAGLLPAVNDYKCGWCSFWFSCGSDVGMYRIVNFIIRPEPDSTG